MQFAEGTGTGTYRLGIAPSPTNQYFVDPKVPNTTITKSSGAFPQRTFAQGNHVPGIVIASGQTLRTVRYEARRTGNRTILRISDSGVGLAPEFYDEVFTPFIADPSGELYDKLEEKSNPEDSSIFGTGSGLGLAIARDIARSRGGDIRFITPESPWSACVEVELP